MRSRQINFFLTAFDQASLLERFSDRGDFAIVNPVSPNGAPHLLETAEIKAMGTDRLAIFLVQRDRIDDIQFKFIAKQTYYIVDVVRSPVIEFDRCYHHANRLNRGRLYFVTAYFDERILIRKDEAFVAWTSSLIAIARRKLRKDPKSFFYFGEDALKLKEVGTEMVEV